MRSECRGPIHALTGAHKCPLRKRKYQVCRVQEYIIIVYKRQENDDLCSNNPTCLNYELNHSLEGIFDDSVPKDSLVGLHRCWPALPFALQGNLGDCYNKF